MPHIQKIYKVDENGKKKLVAYKAVVEVGAGDKRKRRYKTFRIKDGYLQRDVNNWIADLVKDRQEGTLVDPSKITVGEFLDHWLENHKKPKIASTTYDRDKNRIDAHIKPELGYIPLQQLEPYHIDNYFAEKRKEGNKKSGGGLSENTLKKHYIILNSAMKRAIKLKMIKYNPVQAIESPQPEKKKAQVMSEAEFKKLLDVLQEDLFMFTFVFTDLMTGMRRSEILGLEWPEVDLDNRIIEVKQRFVDARGGPKHEQKTKNESSRRKIKISKNLVTILRKFSASQAALRISSGIQKDNNYKKQFVFSRPDYRPYHPKYYNDKFNEYLDKAGLPQEYTIHTLRHTFATLNVKNKVEPEIVQHMLGHSVLSTTMDIYYHHDTEEQLEAVDKLDQIVNLDGF